MSSKGIGLSEICNTLGYTISNQSLVRWMCLYEATCAVIRNADDYEAPGRHKIPSTEDTQMIIELLEDEPGLFLSELRGKMYDGG